VLLLTVLRIVLLLLRDLFLPIAVVLLDAQSVCVLLMLVLFHVVLVVLDQLVLLFLLRLVVLVAVLLFNKMLLSLVIRSRVVMAFVSDPIGKGKRGDQAMLMCWMVSPIAILKDADGQSVFLLINNLANGIVI
jgi:hypothetical protein